MMQDKGKMEGELKKGAFKVKSYLVSQQNKISVNAMSHRIEAVNPSSRCSIDMVEENLWVLLMYSYRRLGSLYMLCRTCVCLLGIRFHVAD